MNAALSSGRAGMTHGSPRQARPSDPLGAAEPRTWRAEDAPEFRAELQERLSHALVQRRADASMRAGGDLDGAAPTCAMRSPRGPAAFSARELDGVLSRLTTRQLQA